MTASDDVFAVRVAGWSWRVNETPTWQPLWVLARLSAQRHELPTLHPEEFMYMGKLVGADVTVHLYKHRATRRYLCVDAAGHTYGLTRGAPADHDQPLIYECQPCRDLAEELRRVVPGTEAVAKLDHPTAPQDSPEASL